MKTCYRNRFLPSSSIAAAAICLATLQVNGTIVGIAGGDGAPGATLGPFTMTPFATDARPEFDPVSSVASPLGGAVSFSPDLTHLVVGSGWTSWSHGFAGDVYWTDGFTSTELTLPSDTAAFYFFGQPNQAQSFEIIAEAQDGTKVSQVVDGNGGASNYGFYGTGGALLSKITVLSTEEFAIGEFGIAKAAAVTVPEGGSWALALSAVGLAGANWMLRRREA